MMHIDSKVNIFRSSEAYEKYRRNLIGGYSLPDNLYENEYPCILIELRSMQPLDYDPKSYCKQGIGTIIITKDQIKELLKED